MFTPSTWYTISKDLSDLWAELEDSTNVLETASLSKNYEKGTAEWYKEQLKTIPNFNQTIRALANKQLKKINDASVEAIKKAIDLVDNETLKAIKKLAGIERDELPNKEEFIASSMQRINDINKGQIGVFVSSASIRNNQFINNINIQTKMPVISAEANIKAETQNLYDTIKRQTEIGIRDGLPVVYRDGKKMPFKSHMEMSIRTTIQNEASNRMEQATLNLGIIFFLASDHADCADDHADYQGKIYIHENWASMVQDEEIRNKISKFIQKNNIKTIQWVKGKPVWFTTRPNCRHFFIPITIEQALGNIKDLKSRLRTSQGTYKKKNYNDLKEQRQNEGTIRFYKNRLVNNQILQRNATEPNLKAKFSGLIDKDVRLVREWQKKNRELIKSNPNLEREYRREDANKMAQDLGVSFEIKDRDVIVIKRNIEGKIVEIPIEYSNMLLKRNAKAKHSEAIKAEPKLTKDIVEITKKTGAYSEGLESKLKSLDSLTRKIRNEYAELKADGIDISIDYITKSINDANRYTSILNEDTFVEQYHNIHNGLLNAGYKLIKTRNTFKMDQVSYKGINSNYENADGVVFELQFHTSESFALKNGKLHELYERYREIETTQERKEEIVREMIKLTSNLKVPKNIDKI